MTKYYSIAPDMPISANSDAQATIANTSIAIAIMQSTIPAVAIPLFVLFSLE